MPLEEAPYTAAVLSDTGMLSSNWTLWLERLRLITGPASDSGTTAQRPTTQLFVGRQYFDTSLGLPVFLKDVSAGTWVNGAGATV